MGIFLKVRVRKYPDGTLTEELSLFPQTLERELTQMVIKAYQAKDYKYLGIHTDGYEMYLVNLRD